MIRRPFRTSGPRAVVLPLLVALADVLFYRHSPGLSLAIFAVALFAAATLPMVRPGSGAWVMLLLSILPVVEHVQALSGLILVLGLVTSICWAHLGQLRPSAVLAKAAGLARIWPFQALRDLLALIKELHRQADVRAVRVQVWRNWAFPLGGALVLVSLLVQANPVLEGWLSGMADLPLDPGEILSRLTFWSGVAIAIWPLLGVDRANPVLLFLPERRIWLGLNPDAVRNALIGFNAILGLQTILDGRYLWSGLGAPSGMSLAEYAHRGAYPLLATALLAGAFALAARPFLAERRWLRPVLLLWIGQNILLALSAVYRLDLYVGAFGLTYLRIHAGIWMLLVAAGLALVLWQVAMNRSNRWLLLRCAVLGLGTLYVCAFVNFAAVIARHNIASGPLGNFDKVYLCSLGPTASAEVPQSLKDICCTWAGSAPDCLFPVPRIMGWRDWGYRNWRVLRYLEREGQSEAPLEDPRRG